MLSLNIRKKDTGDVLVQDGKETGIASTSVKWASQVMRNHMK
jgi:hypothetical protein